MLLTPAAREYRTWTVDSRRWRHYRPRTGDIVISTYPKCGTTWMQRIVGLLVFQRPEPLPVMDISPWIDRRFPEAIADTMARIEAQEHRRFLKAHLPVDGLPIFDEVKYIHVARDGRDAAMSFHNHALALSPEMLEGMDRCGREDETIARPYPRMPQDPAAAFRRWLTEGAVPGHGDGMPFMSFFHLVQSWWDARHGGNVLLVHYNDLKGDLGSEMRRVAAFLGIGVPDELWPVLVDAAGFDAMRRDGDALLGRAASGFLGGGRRFFHKGTNSRWRGIFRDEDLALYEGRVASRLSPECARWMARGRAGTEPAASSAPAAGAQNV